MAYRIAPLSMTLSDFKVILYIASHFKCAFLRVSNICTQVDKIPTDSALHKFIVGQCIPHVQQCICLGQTCLNTVVFCKSRSSCFVFLEIIVELPSCICYTV